ncbi:MAG TPA: hypothetical protein VF021_06500 [Longimicrobiales bacterium]
MTECFFCGANLGPLSADELPARRRVAFDPRLGRLWQICASCQRWNAWPIEDRWEILEQCERWAHDDGKLLLDTPHLALLAVAGAQLVRVGAPPRLDFADWRYSSRLDAFPVERRGFFERMILSVPERPVEGYRYQGETRPIEPIWAGGAFIEHGGLLAALFSEVPLTSRCPSCSHPLAIHPAHFGNIEVGRIRGVAHVNAKCALCGDIVVVPAVLARAALRAGLAIVSRRYRKPAQIASAARRVEQAGSALDFVDRLARMQLSLGSLTARERVALWMSLDEWAEADALEAEWKTAEAITSVSDGELTEVTGFQEFRARVLGGDGD